MIKYRVIKDESGTINLCETYSDNKDCIGFLQVETGKTYIDNPIDGIAGFKGDEPYPLFTYEEVLEEDEGE